MVEIHVESPGRVLITLSGKLTVQDYERFVPTLDELARAGKLRLLVEMHDFAGWTAGALWEDAKFAANHFSDIERIAFVGEKAWQHGLAIFCKPFTAAKVRYFDRQDVQAARAWMEEDAAVAAH